MITTVPVDKLRDAVDRWLIRNGFHPITWYTPEQWRTKGEDICIDADLHAVIDGDFAAVVDRAATDEFADLDDLFRSYGYWLERGFAWSIHLYPLT